MVLIFKLVVSLGLLALLLVGIKFDLSRLPDRQFTVLSWTTLAALRLVVFVALYLLAGLTRLQITCRFLIGTWRVMLEERSEWQRSAVTEIQFA